MSTATVTGNRFFDASGNPEFGYVTFTPSATLTDARGNVILNATPIAANVIGGSMIPQQLLRTDTANVVQTDWVWQAQEFVSSSGPSMNTRAYTFSLPSTLGASVDLQTLRPAGAAAAVTTVTPLAVTGTPTVGQVLTATGSNAATWQAASGGSSYQTIVAAPTGVQATDAANINAAITAAGANGTLYFPYSATAYVADQLAPLTGQTWYGEATIQRPAGSTNSVVTATGISNFTMRDLTIDGNRSGSTATSNAAVYLINTTWTRIQGVTFQNCPTQNSALILRGPVRALVDGCEFTNVGYAISLGLNHGDAYACYGNEIRGCLIDGTDMDAIFLTENLGSIAATVVGSVFGTVVADCTVRNFGDTGCEIGSGTVNTQVTGCTFIGIGNGVGNQGLLFRDAAHASATGCTVSNLTKTGSNGVYVIDLNGSCTDIDITDININTTGYGILAVGGTSPTTIGTAHKNITISGGTIDTTVADGIQLTNVSGATINGTEILNAGNQGISLGKFNTASSGPSDVEITNVRVENSSQATAGSFSGIVMFQNTTRVNITGGRVGDNQGSPTQGYGIRIFDSTVSSVKIESVDVSSGGTVANFSNASSAANGIEVYRCTGITPTGLRTAITRDVGSWDAADHGLTAWTYDPAISAMSSSIPVAGCLYLQGIQARAPFTTTKGYYVMTVAGATPTAGANWLGLYNSSGTLCASAALDTQITGATGLQTVTWSASYTGAAGQYWIALLFNAGTRPTLARLTTTSDNATPNAGLGSAATYRFCQQGTGLTALPTPLTVASNSISSSPDSPRTWWAAIG